VGETFCEGRESVTDEERSGWPATSRTEENIAKVAQIVRENIVYCHLWPLGLYHILPHYLIKDEGFT
jgi:hypothetical protein